MNASFHNQTIVLIGASSGIGLEVAKLLAQQGAMLTIASRSQDKLEQAAQLIGRNVSVRTIDTLDETSVQAFFNAFNAGEIDHLINFAGDTMGGGVLTSDIAGARNAVESKFWGQFYVGRYGGAKIKPSGSLTFTAGSGPRPHQAIATVAANAGVSLLAESLAKELAPVRVNVVAPYYVDTPMWAGMAADARRELFNQVAAQLPVGFIAKPEEIAPTYLYLMQTRYLNAATIPVNGGALLQTIE
jgi:NAD(P)-dependent dehydrogenase (short-subunit alcohol dehydrogenase family)